MRSSLYCSLIPLNCQGGKALQTSVFVRTQKTLLQTIDLLNLHLASCTRAITLLVMFLDLNKFGALAIDNRAFAVIFVY